jgi:hypothetical protein
MKEMSHHSQLGSDVVHGIISGVRTNDLEWSTNKLRSNNLMKPEHWDALLDRQDLPASLVNTVAETAAPSPERWKSIADKLDPAKYDTERAWHDIIAKNPSVPDEILNRFIDHGHEQFLNSHLYAKEDQKPEALSRIYDKLVASDDFLERNSRKLSILKSLATKENLPQDVIEKLYDKMLVHHDNERHSYDIENIRRTLVDHHNAPLSLINKALRDPSVNVQDKAQGKMGEHDPDAVNAALNGHEIDVHPAIEKLKHFKGLVQELGNGEPIPKGKLPNKGQGMPNEVFDAKGQVSPRSVDEFIDKLPKDKYNITYTNWNGAQRHDRNKNQLVMQVNLTNKLVGDLKEQGLWPLFQKIHNSSYRSGHPVRKHSLGWARLDMSHPEHAHIDEIQSDLGQGSIRQIEEYASKGRMDKAQAEEMVGGIKKIIKTLSGQFKNINQVISAAVHHTFRLHPEQLKSPEGETLAPIKGVSYDMLKDQAKQSSMHTDVNVNHDTLKNFYDGDLNPDDYTHRAISAWAKSNGVEGNPEIGLEKFKEQHGAVGKLDVPVPGFMKETYQQMPEAMGYKPEEKAKVMPDSQSGYGETQVQYRKLTKSLTKLRNLANMLRELQEKK